MTLRAVVRFAWMPALELEPFRKSGGRAARVAGFLKRTGDVNWE
jgi:hypothetical protein